MLTILQGLSDHSVTLNQVDFRRRSSLESHVVTRQTNLTGINAFDWSRRDESLIVVGHKAGSASLIRLRGKDEGPSIVALYKPRQERKCNAVALSTENWLAVGLDRIRADPACLNVHDTNIGTQVQPEPIRRLCPNESVSSVRFFPTHPQELLVTVQRSLLRLYDLRDGSSGSNAAVQVATRNIHNLAVDPLDENYFASSGTAGEPTVTIWDKRWMSQSVTGSNSTGAVFDFRHAVDTPGASIWSLRYSGQKRGRLAVCSSAGELRVIDTVEGRQSSLHSSIYLPINPHGGSNWTSNRFVSSVRSVQKPYSEDRDGPISQAKLVAFDWITSSRPSREQSVITLRPNGKVHLLQVPSVVVNAGVTARNDFTLAYDDLSITEIKTSLDHVGRAPYEVALTAEDFGPQEYTGEDDMFERMGPKWKVGRDSHKISPVLAPSMVPRERCRRGYLFDCQKNMSIVAGNWQLERLWEIVGRFQEQAANNGMVAESLNLSYVGVASLWMEDIALSPSRKLSISSATIADAIVSLNIAQEIPPFEGERTDFPEHRQLCLAVCGWKFTVDTLEAECNELIGRGLYYQAIVQAVLHGYKHLALNLLRTLIRSKTIPNIGLNALLASDTLNESQREMCLWMAADTDDPALKALLTFLSTDDWRDVMKTNYLHLGYRVALGLRYLNDTELSGFIQSETARAVRNGDLEGILLTGLDAPAMDLLQTYIAKTNDLQTAVLATAFTHPRYVADDPRWEMWKETYFEQMQQWRMFNERVQFTVQHVQMARAHDGRSLIAPAPAQIVLRCIHCQSSLARHDGRQPLLFGEVRPPSSGPVVTTTPATQTPTQSRIIGPAANAGIVCPHCGRHMPRCGICKLWLGTPDPRTTSSALRSGNGVGSSGGGTPAGATTPSEKRFAQQHERKEKMNELMAKFLTFCLRCGHGFHADHARAWFERHPVCPVPDCRCTCTV